MSRGVTRGVQGGHNSPGAEKSQQCHKHFFTTVNFRFEHRGAKLAFCPGRHLTSLRPCSFRKLQSWFSVKDRQALPNRFNVVYKLTCSCGASYIGQTQRNLINRIEEHRTSLSSSVCRHLQTNPDNRVDFHNPEVIGSDNNGRRLQILESLLIQEYKPELNANIPSMPLCIFDLKQGFMLPS